MALGKANVEPIVPWRDQKSVRCLLCEAAFRASSDGMLRRILDEHIVKSHGIPAQDAMQAVDPLP